MTDNLEPLSSGPHTHRTTPVTTTRKPGWWLWMLLGLGVLVGVFLLGRLFIGEPTSLFPAVTPEAAAAARALGEGRPPVPPPPPAPPR